jgi:hypothetical protein
VAALAQMRSSPAFQTLLIWLVFAGIAVTQTYDLPLAELLSGPDDDMRIVRVRALLDGAGWYDDRILRINPPEGAELHWSRLPDLPLVGTILALAPLTGEAAATRAAAIAVPMVLGLGYLLALTWAVQPLVPRQYAAAAALAAVTLIGFKSFWPGRVDHHGWMMIALALALGALLRSSIRAPDARAAQVGAGVAVAVGLAATVETVLAYAAAMAGLLGLWVWRGPAVAAEARRFAVAAALTGLALLPVEQAPAAWSRVACDAFSLPYLGGLNAGLLIWLAAPWTAGAAAGPGRRLAVGAGWAALAAGGLLLAFPECRAGPLSQVPADQWPLWLSHAGGMTPLRSEGWTVAVLLLAPVGIGALGLLAYARSDGRAAPVLALGGVLGVMGGLTVAALRGHWAAHPATALALALTLTAAWSAATQRWTGWRRAAAANAATVAVLLSPLIAAGVGELSTPDQTEAADQCPRSELDEVLTATADAPGLIAGPIFQGPDILLASPHRVLGAPYHRNVAGNRAAGRILTAESAAAARAWVVRAGVDYLLACRRSAPYDSRFYVRLGAGTAPDWLAQVAVSPNGAYLFYRVRLPDTGQDDDMSS